MKNYYCYILEKMDCFVYFDCAQQPPRNDALLLICTNPRKSVIANEVKQRRSPQRS